MVNLLKLLDPTRSDIHTVCQMGTCEAFETLLEELLDKASGASRYRTDWREQPRTDEVNAVISLLQQGNVCIHGMSGEGKSVLAQQVRHAAPIRARFSDRIAELDLSNLVRLETGRLPGDAAPIASKLPFVRSMVAGKLAALARTLPAYIHPTAPTPQPLLDVAKHLGSDAVRADAAGHRDVQAWLDRVKAAGTGFDPLLRALCSWDEGRDTPARVSQHLIDVILTALAGLFDDDRRALLILDDCWEWRILSGFLHCLLAPGLPVRILATSQQRPGIGFLPFDMPDLWGHDAGNQDVAWGILAAYASDREEDLADTLRTLQAGTEAASVAQLIAEVGAHPLTLAASGALWRLSGRQPGFWDRRRASLGRASADESAAGRLAAEPGFKERHRHLQILDTLSESMGLLSSADRTRYQNLLALPADAFGLALPALLWQGTPPGDPGLDTRSAQELIERLIDAALLKPLSGPDASPEDVRVRLHERHRDMLMSRLPLPGLPHQALLQAAGCLTGSNAFQPPAFDPDPAGVRPCAIRATGRPFLRDRSVPVLEFRIAVYLLDGLPHHYAEWVRMDPDARDPAALALDFCFLSCRLAVLGLPALIDALPPQGAAPNADLVRGALELSRTPLTGSHKDPAGQLIGRLFPDRSIGLAALLVAARRHAPRPALIPDRACLTPPGGPILRRFRVEGQVMAIDEQTLIAVEGPSLRFWSLQGEPMGPAHAHVHGSARVESVAITGDRAISGGDDGSVVLWARPDEDGGPIADMPVAPSQTVQPIGGSLQLARDPCAIQRRRGGAVLHHPLQQGS